MARGSTHHEEQIRELYKNLIESWNQRDAKNFSNLFSKDGSLVGFDGSQINTRSEIESHLSDIFRAHQTATFVYKIEEARELSSEVVLLRSIAGMVPRGGDDINPNVNTIQTLVASRHDGVWKIDLFQNTPAAFHGRPELVQKMSAELRSELKK